MVVVAGPMGASIGSNDTLIVVDLAKTVSKSPLPPAVKDRQSHGAAKTNVLRVVLGLVINGDAVKVMALAGSTVAMVRRRRRYFRYSRLGVHRIEVTNHRSRGL